MRGKPIDKKTKQNVFEAYENGVSRKKIAERFDISLSSVARIVRENSPGHSQQRERGLGREDRQKKIEYLERRIAELEMEIDALKEKKDREQDWRKFLKCPIG